MHACNNTSRRCVYKATNSPAPSHLSQKRGQPGSYDATQTSPAGASASTNPVPQGQAHQPTQSCRGSSSTNPSPAGTKENSPGLQSWVNPGTRAVPSGTAASTPESNPRASSPTEPQSRRRKRINNPSPAGASASTTQVPQAQAHQQPQSRRRKRINQPQSRRDERK
jgi:hypothetical protein